MGLGGVRRVVPDWMRSGGGVNEWCETGCGEAGIVELGGVR